MNFFVQTQRKNKNSQQFIKTKTTHKIIKKQKRFIGKTIEKPKFKKLGMKAT